MTTKTNVFALDASRQAWVDRTFAGMSLRRKVGQIINVALSWWEADHEVDSATAAAFEDCQPGSSVGGGPTMTWREVRALVETLNRRVEIPLIVNGDWESGSGLLDGTGFPDAMGMSAIADRDLGERLEYAAGRTAALQGRAVGVQWALAPVVDINRNFRNPITNVRSFGDEPETVKRMATAYIRGLQDNAMAATAKHFPGDGYSDLDHHKLTTVNPLSRREWLAQSGGVFKHVIDQGVYTIMPGHIALPSLDGSTNERGRPVPASLSRTLLTDVLRGELGFTGLIVSDALDMGGCLEHTRGTAEAAIRSLNAGVDCILCIGAPLLREVAEALVKAVETGELTEQRLDEAVRRMLSLKARLGLTPEEFRMPTEAEAARIYEPPIHAKESLAASELSVTLTHDLLGDLPLKAGRLKKVLINYLNEEVFWDASGKRGVSGQSDPKTLSEEFASRGIDADVVEDPGEGDTLKRMGAYDAIFYLFNNGGAPSRCNIMPCRQALRDIDWKVINSEKPVIFVALRSPYLRCYLPGIPNLICTYSDQAASQRALAKAILGEIPFAGRLPVTLPPAIG